MSLFVKVGADEKVGLAIRPNLQLITTPVDLGVGIIQPGFSQDRIVLAKFKDVETLAEKLVVVNRDSCLLDGAVGVSLSAVCQENGVAGGLRKRIDVHVGHLRELLIEVVA